MQTSAPAREIWQAFLTCTPRLKAGGYLSLCHCVYVCASVCVCLCVYVCVWVHGVLRKHAHKIKLCVFCDFIFITQPCSWVHLCFFNVPVHLHSRGIYLRLHFLECTVGIGGPGGVCVCVCEGGGHRGRTDATQPPTSLFFAARCLKEMRPHTTGGCQAGPAGRASLPSQGAGAGTSHDRRRSR